MTFQFPSAHHNYNWGSPSSGTHAASASGFDKHSAQHALDFLVEHDLSHPRKADQIQPGLYLGDLTSAKDLKALQTKKITHVLSVCHCPDLHYPESMHIDHKVIDVDDAKEEDLLDHFLECWRFITYALDEGGRVYVHCEQGISRSAAVMAAFLMKTERLHSIEAIKYIQRFRPIVDPNAGFREQLHIWGQCKGQLAGRIEYTSWKQKQAKLLARAH